MSAVVVISSACGGTASTPPTPPTPPVRHMSYNGVSDTFERIHAKELLDRGYTGEGVISALLDSEFNFSNPALVNKESQHINRQALVRAIPGSAGILSPSGVVLYRQWETELLENTPSEVQYSSNDGHGTAMAKILAGHLDEKTNEVGIARNTKLLAYPDIGLFDSLLSAKRKNASIASISLQGASNGDITGNYIVDGGHQELKDLMIVAIAGNGANNDPTTFNGNLPINPRPQNLIVTVALDSENNLTEQSLSCSQMQDFCLGVPSPSATSPTAPLVAGALSLLKEAFPNLDAWQIVQAALFTATRLEDAEFTGRGLLNVEAAYQHLKSTYPLELQEPRT